MMSKRMLSLAILLLATTVLVASGPDPQQAVTRPVAVQTKGTSQGKVLPLTVDSIMRGPKLVGYEPTGLRWSGDSKEVYFEWRRPQDDEAATWVVSRDAGEPRKLTDDERRNVPPVATLNSPSLSRMRTLLA